MLHIEIDIELVVTIFFLFCEMLARDCLSYVSLPTVVPRNLED